MVESVATNKKVFWAGIYLFSIILANLFVSFYF